jgi:hypothetical protein
MDAPVMYVVRFWVDPKGHQEVFAWLDGGHNHEVVAEPGYRFLQRLKLDQKSDDGWDSYLNIYGLESRAALDKYFANQPLHAKFSRERGPIEKYLRIDRAWGEVDLSLTHQN